MQAAPRAHIRSVLPFSATAMLIAATVQDTADRCLASFRQAYNRDPDTSEVSVRPIALHLGLRRQIAVDVELSSAA